MKPWNLMIACMAAVALLLAACEDQPTSPPASRVPATTPPATAPPEVTPAATPEAVELDEPGISLDDSARVPATQPASAPVSQDLETLLGVSRATITEEGALRVNGWCVSGETIEKIEIRFGDFAVGHAELGLKRPDILAAHPEYGDAESGFVFEGEVEGAAFGGRGLVRVFGFDDEILAQQTFTIR